MARFNEPIEPMTLGNMRANGVRSLDVSCWQCHRRAVMSADPWRDEVPVSSFGPRMMCTRCGIVGADVPAELAGGVEIGAPAVAALPGGSLLPRNRPRTWILLRASDGY
jgi:hypothetical protein